MNSEANKLLAKARRALRAAEVLVAAGEAEFAAGRAYYAMFYAAEAALLGAGLSFRRHSGVHSAFGEQFVRAGKVDPQYHRWLLDAFDRRIICDYEIECPVTVDESRLMIERARQFVAVIAGLLPAD